MRELRRAAGIVVAAALAFVQAGCASESYGQTGVSTAPPAPSQEARELPIPEDLKPHLARALDLGHAIYQHDFVSSRGTDVLLEKVGEEEASKQQLGGYITVRGADADGTPADWWLVLFYTRGPAPRMRYRVRIWPNGRKAPQLEELEPPQDLKPGLQLLISARQAAIEAIGQPEQPLNPVVLPAESIGEHGILVYLIAGTKRPGVAVMGRHYRVLV